MGELVNIFEDISPKDSGFVTILETIGHRHDPGYYFT